MVGIEHKEDSFLASIDQMDLLGLTIADRNRPIKFLRDRVKRVKYILHPDKLGNLPAGATLPYNAVQANVVGDFLKDGIMDSRSKKPADDRILAAFWQDASIGHRRRWMPFTNEGEPRSALELATFAPTPPVTPERVTMPQHDVPWSGERERRPYGGAAKTQSRSRSPSPYKQKQEPEVPQEQREATPDKSADKGYKCEEPSADEPFTDSDLAAQRAARSFPLGKLFTLAADKDGRKFAFARTRLRKINGRQKWALVAASLGKGNKLRFSLIPRDINRNGSPLDQWLGGQGTSISWERMVRGGWFGLGRFKNATKEDIREFAMEQALDNGAE